MNDNKLIKQCQKGNKEAFNELIKIYYPYLFKFLLKLTSKKEIAEDLVQETFIKIINNIEQFNVHSKTSFSTYLLTIAKHTYIDYLRKNNKELADIDINTLPDQKDFTSTISSHENYQTLLEKIDHLPSLQKEAIKLKYLEGYTLEETAKKQQVSSKTIKSRLFEARKKLKEKLKGTDLYE